MPLARCSSAAVEEALCPGVLPEAVTMLGWRGGLRLVSLLVARTSGAWPYRATDATAYVKPYVKRQKNDAADAEAICEAVNKATMRFAPTRTPEQQSCLMLH